MLKYRYSYIAESVFAPPVERHFFKLRVLPCENEFQRVVHSELEITPSCLMGRSKDGLGNEAQWGGFDEFHQMFRVSSSGVIKQCIPYQLHEKPAPYYWAFTHLTACSDEMAQLASAVPANGRVFDQANVLMHLVHQHMNYVPGSTTIRTTAAEGFEMACGVCQDYAHLMIALCRKRGIPARYVNGLIPGCGETHAWVEVSDGHVWRAFDPTHDRIIEWGYIKIAHGRDADDCPVNRGRFFGWTQECMSIEARVDIV